MTWIAGLDEEDCEEPRRGRLKEVLMTVRRYEELPRPVCRLTALQQDVPLVFVPGPLLRMTSPGACRPTQRVLPLASSLRIVFGLHASSRLEDAACRIQLCRQPVESDECLGTGDNRGL